MMGKQIITDIVVVIILPLLLLGGFYWFKTDDGSLLSFAAPTEIAPGDEGQELGVKTTNALTLLRSIPSQLDQSLFNDQAYLMLKDYRVTIPTVPLGRSNPFTPPPVLENLQQLSRGSDAAPVREVKPTPLSSAKVDALKKSGTN